MIRCSSSTESCVVLGRERKQWGGGETSASANDLCQMSIRFHTEDLVPATSCLRSVPTSSSARHDAREKHVEYN